MSHTFCRPCLHTNRGHSHHPSPSSNHFTHISPPSDASHLQAGTCARLDASKGLLKSGHCGRLIIRLLRPAAPPQSTSARGSIGSIAAASPDTFRVNGFAANDWGDPFDILILSQYRVSALPYQIPAWACSMAYTIFAMVSFSQGCTYTTMSWILRKLACANITVLMSGEN